MAKKVTTVLIDDIDKSEAAETINFSLDNVSYEIDLNAEHARELRESMQSWINSARKVSGRRRRGTGPAVNAEARELNRKVRSWASEQGIAVNDRGRVPQALIDKYMASHK